MKSKKKESTITAEDVINQLMAFYGCYNIWREENGLAKTTNSIHETCNAMTDKHGRICRYIKHKERQDPIEAWQHKMAQDLMGYLVYSSMVLEYYKKSGLSGEDLKVGFVSELKKAIAQHRK